MIQYHQFAIASFLRRALFPFSERGNAPTPPSYTNFTPTCPSNRYHIISILDLVTDNNTKDVEPSDYENLALHITSWMQSGGTKEDLSWEIDGILQDPNRIGEMPIDFLIDMGNEIGFDWRSYLIF